MGQQRGLVRQGPVSQEDEDVSEQPPAQQASSAGSCAGSAGCSDMNSAVQHTSPARNRSIRRPPAPCRSCLRDTILREESLDLLIEHLL